jgi:pilus assembly protein CpaC
MVRFILLLELAVALMPQAALADLPITSDPLPITLYVGEARVLNETNIRRMAVGNGHVITSNIISSSQLLLLAEEAGQSTVHLWHRDGTEDDYAVTVVSANAGRLLAEVRALVNDDPKIRVRIVGDKVVLEGSDLGKEESTRIADITKLYPQIVNLVSQVTLDQMVEIDVRIMEFRKSTLSALGITWATSGIVGPTAGIAGDAVRNGAFLPPPSGSGLANVPNIAIAPKVSSLSSYLGIATSITSAIDAAVSKGEATFLSEPKLTCKSGGQCKFLSGGEVPIPISTGFGEVSVQFKPYGVKLDVEPVIGDSGLIHMKAFTELSAIDPTVTVAGIPGFITRRTDTEVNLASDQTLVISGLFDGSDNENLYKVPGVGDVPVLGELFKSRNFQKKKSDLVIFLTPHLVAADSPSNLAAVKSGEEKRTEALNHTHLAE